MSFESTIKLEPLVKIAFQKKPKSFSIFKLFMQTLVTLVSGNRYVPHEEYMQYFKMHIT